MKLIKITKSQLMALIDNFDFKEDDIKECIELTGLNIKEYIKACNARDTIFYHIKHYKHKIGIVLYHKDNKVSLFTTNDLIEKYNFKYVGMLVKLLKSNKVCKHFPLEATASSWHEKGNKILQMLKFEIYYKDKDKIVYLYRFKK